MCRFCDDDCYVLGIEKLNNNSKQPKRPKITKKGSSNVLYNLGNNQVCISRSEANENLIKR